MMDVNDTAEIKCLKEQNNEMSEIENKTGKIEN